MNNQLNIIPIKELEHYKLYGRMPRFKSKIPLFTSGCGIEFNVKGAELWIEFDIKYKTYELWISIFVNDAFYSRMMLQEGKRWICIFRGLDNNSCKNVKIFREVQGMPDDTEMQLLICNIGIRGELLNVPEKKLKIEFIGDSITAGEGTIGSQIEADWCSSFFSTYNSYPFMVANRLHADFRIIASSGWGVCCGWDNNPETNIPRIYDKICGQLTGERNQRLGALKKNKFECWHPDYIIINLGTNDGTALTGEPWTKEEDNKEYKLENKKVFIKKGIEFLKQIRSLNGSCNIIWCYGMLNNTMNTPIVKLVNEYIERSGDTKVFLCRLPFTKKVDLGAIAHPGVNAHSQVSDIIVKKLTELGA